ncbi:MAG: hypothetical protein IJ828_05550 [Treponema sp.]|nr:hypothetical protein [Treponema sp.]
MLFFPSTHSTITITPLMPADVISRIKKLTEKDRFKGTFLGSMFTIHYTVFMLNAFKVPVDPVITGYFSNDKKNIVLDYNMSKTGKIKLLAYTFLLPLIVSLLYIHVAHISFDRPVIFFVFYLLCALFIYFINILLFKFKTKHIHRKIFIQVLY